MAVMNFSPCYYQLMRGHGRSQSLSLYTRNTGVVDVAACTVISLALLHCSFLFHTSFSKEETIALLNRGFSEGPTITALGLQVYKIDLCMFAASSLRSRGPFHAVLSFAW